MVQVMPPIKGSIDLDALAGTAKSVGHLSKQFEGFTGGPAEARSRHEGPTPSGRNRVDPADQGQLFDPEKIPHQEAHHQSPEQFARDPRTWWHGRVMTDSPRSRLPGKPAGRDEGFHAGTEAAARQRVTYNIKRKGLKEGKVGRMFPLRITGPVRSPEEAKPDVMRHRELGAWGSHGGAGYLYKNVVEGAEGDLSVGTPGRKGYLSTHKEMVMAAEKRGEKVNPTISWAARNAPEHTGEAMKERFAHRMNEGASQGRQMGLHEQHPMDSEPRMQSFMELHPERTKTHRASYVTQGGRRQSVYAFPSPGETTLGKQWHSSGHSTHEPMEWTPEMEGKLKQVASAVANYPAWKASQG